MREIFKFVSHQQIAKDLRTVIEDARMVFILGPNRELNLEFMKAVCRSRLPLGHKIGSAKSAAEIEGLNLEDATWLIESETQTQSQILTAALRQDPEGLYITELQPESLELFINGLLTGHTVDTTVVFAADDAESLLAQWAEVSGDLQYLLECSIPDAYLVELSSQAGVTPLRAIRRALVQDGKWRVEDLVRRGSRPTLPGRDSTLEQAALEYHYLKTLVEPTSPSGASLENFDPSKYNQPVTSAEVAAWTDEAKTHPLRGQLMDLAKDAWVPLSTQISDQEKSAFLAEVGRSPNWPLTSTQAPFHLLAQFRAESLPPSLQRSVGLGNVIQFFYATEDDPGRPNDDRFDPFTTAFRAVRVPVQDLTKNAGSPFPVDLLREDYKIEKWVRIEDLPDWQELRNQGRLGADTDEWPSICYRMNKLEGWPAWKQAAATPHCRVCQKQMSLFMQLECSRGEFNLYLGSDFSGYVFHCEAHPQEWAFVQQTSQPVKASAGLNFRRM